MRKHGPVDVGWIVIGTLCVVSFVTLGIFMVTMGVFIIKDYAVMEERQVGENLYEEVPASAASQWVCGSLCILVGLLCLGTLTYIAHEEYGPWCGKHWRRLRSSLRSRFSRRAKKETQDEVTCEMRADAFNYQRFTSPELRNALAIMSRTMGARVAWETEQNMRRSLGLDVHPSPYLRGDEAVIISHNGDILHRIGVQHDKPEAFTIKPIGDVHVGSDVNVEQNAYVKKISESLVQKGEENGNA